MNIVCIPKGWSRAELQQLVYFQRGFDITKAQQQPGDIPVISSSGITSFHNQAKAQGPGIIIGRKGTLGTIHFSEGAYWPHDTTLWSKRLYENNPRFVYYYLHLFDFQHLDVGNANPTLNRNHIHKLEIAIAPKEIQHSIASILSAYDDLIATNQRRIALLEDAARRIYREWFVHLRFPGHETVAVKDGVPEGWELKPLGDIAPLNYGKALKSANRKDGKVLVYGSSGIVGMHSIALVDSRAIVVGRKGNVGSLYFSPVPCFPIDTVYYIAPAHASYRLFLALHQLNFISSDAAVPGLNRTYAHSLPILQPSDEVAVAFEYLVQPMFEQSHHLTEQNAQLAHARNLLLPKLMSGQLDVSGIRLPDEIAT